MAQRRMTLKRGQEVWLTSSFRADGKSLAGCSGIVTGSYMENKYCTYVVRTADHGLVHGRVENFHLKDPNAEPA